MSKYSPFNDQIKKELDSLISPNNLEAGASCISKISDLILKQVHLKDASKVIKHITKTQFEGDAKPDEISKKYIFFYISHDLIFKSKELNIETQVLEIDPENEALNEELEIDKLSYVYAIGDHL
jgi:hypothetical protein